MYFIILLILTDLISINQEAKLKDYCDPQFSEVFRNNYKVHSYEETFTVFFSARNGRGRHLVSKFGENVHNQSGNDVLRFNDASSKEVLKRLTLIAKKYDAELRSSNFIVDQAVSGENSESRNKRIMRFMNDNNIDEETCIMLVSVNKPHYN